MQMILEMSNHATADEAYTTRVTVYRSLPNLEQLLAIRRIGSAGKAKRNDGRAERYHYLICIGCGTVLLVADPKPDAVAVLHTASLGFALKDGHVQMSGYGRHCPMVRRQKQKQK